MLINQRIINLERNQEQYFLSQSNNSHLIMSDELIYMEDCVLDLINSSKFNEFLNTTKKQYDKTFEIHLHYFQTCLRIFFEKLAFNRQLFKKKKKFTIFNNKIKTCNCNFLLNHKVCICLNYDHYYDNDEIEIQSILVSALIYIFKCWHNKKKIGIDIFEFDYQPTLRILQCGYEI